jgi:protease I
MAELSNVRVAVISTNGVEESEIVEPLKALRDAGVRAEVLSPKGGDIQMMRHDEKSSKIPSDRRVSDVRPEDYEAVVLPGGALNADELRMVPEVRTFAQSMNAYQKPMAVICHAPWVLVSAGLARGRTLTSYYTIQDDIRNAGGNWVDQEVVLDNNLITSRSPRDLPAFNRELTQALSRVAAMAGMASRGTV